ncbi:hypothetical protein BOTBODRAFT_167611 [Botryobasidium botryosum FD-172 SS1]|uniref:HTH TFE/IIEalpha-type domain-containing protein n=1 Tax=Botryobasidium botryosum (strain FD-172 SS1) TaxID=930990 RepID=A0A067LUC0_BOTB1|nr:hypothetical protein BOTBODRAFT_167611 [Botryobasidium botryosum FD-172 SS1]
MTMDPTANSRAEQRRTLRHLVQHVSRAFYESKLVVIMDQLARHDVLKDDDLAGRMGYNIKDLGKAIAPLVNDKLVSSYHQNEQKDANVNRSYIKKYFYIDYRNFCNVVKWRMAEMRRLIDDKLRNELANKGYLCPQCGKNFSILDADRLIDLSRGGFSCDTCGAELRDNNETEDITGKQDRMQRFNAQTQWIREGLRKTEEMVLPAFDIEEWVRKHIAANAVTDNTRVDDDGLAIAGSSGIASHVQKLSVEIIGDADSEARRLAKEEEAQAKREQNALPTWYTHSTINGGPTKLGIAEASTMGYTFALDGSQNEDVKPDVNGSADFYADYYAQLAATEGTAGDEDYGTPGTQDSSASSSGKRRHEDDAAAADEPPARHLKFPRLERSEGRTTSFGSDTSVDSGVHIMPTPEITVEAEAEDMGDVGMGSADDPIVYVVGKPMRLSQVTEEHHDLMTPEEYSAYTTEILGRGGDEWA